MDEHVAEASWRWPRYCDRWRSGRRASTGGRIGSAPGGRPWSRTLAAACYVEWRYFAVLSPVFQGIVGLALVNPEARFSSIAEGGLLLIVAGVFEPGIAFAEATEGPAPASTETSAEAAELCWMHLFDTADCRFDAPAPGAVDASDRTCRLRLRQPASAQAELEVVTESGLEIRLQHQGVDGVLMEPVLAQDFDPGLAGWLGGHWRVDCPAPLARCDGEIALGPDAVAALAAAPGGANPSYASAALRARLAAGRRSFAWSGANGYAEHSYGVRPLALHGWDFLFAPNGQSGESVVLQTYRGSRRLRYLEVCWRQDGRARHHRFDTDGFELEWTERAHDPVLGVVRPLRRSITARGGGLRLRLDNRVLHRVPLLRRGKLAVRHFFISEELGVVDWSLEDAQGQRLVEVRSQPCGGELAHFRLRAPRIGP